MWGLPTPNAFSLNDAVIAIVRLFAVGGSLYFFAGIVLNLFQAQISSAFGDRPGYAHAMEQVIAMTLLVSVAAATWPISESLKPAMHAVTGSGNAVDGVVVFWQGLARLVVGFLVGAAIMAMMVKVSYSGVMGQFGLMLGAPGAVSGAVMNIATALTGGLVTILGVWLANTLLTKIIGGG